jgi:hypothetical protein
MGSSITIDFHWYQRDAGPKSMIERTTEAHGRIIAPQDGMLAQR